MCATGCRGRKITVEHSMENEDFITMVRKDLCCMMLPGSHQVYEGMERDCRELYAGCFDYTILQKENKGKLL